MGERDASEDPTPEAGQAVEEPAREAPKKPVPPFRVTFGEPIGTFQRTSPAVFLRGCQSEAILAWRESQKKRKVISLPTGCVSGDAEVRVSRAGKGFKITLADLFHKFNGGASSRGKTWDPNIRTFARALAGTDLRLHGISAVLDQGTQQVLKITLASGKSIKVTPDHEICTSVDDDGRQTFARADILKPGDGVVANGRTRCSTTDNSLKNLVPKAKSEHQREHGPEHKFRNMHGGRGGKGGDVWFVPTRDVVASIEPAGVERVYDIVCDDPWRNFVANGIVVHNCGKTITALTLAAETTLGRTLWIAHRDELITQPCDEIVRSFHGLEFGVVKAGRNDWGSRLVIASVQTLAKRKRLMDLARSSPFSLVVVDEAHHSTSRSYVSILESLGCFDEGGPEVLGLTATVERADKRSLADVFEEIVYAISISEAIDSGYLVPPRPLKVPLALDPRALRVVEAADGERDFSQADLEKELARTNAARATALAILEHAKGRKTVVFTVSVDQAKRTTEELTALGAKAAWASGAPYMSVSERRETVAKFKRREIDVVVNAALLSEGWDDKEVECVVIAKPTKSKGAYCQMVGRGLRLYPGKRDCLVIDIVGASDLGLVTIDAYLAETKKDHAPRKKRDPRAGPADPEAEWRRIRSYLRSARVDFVPHGDTTFVRASDDLLVTVTADGNLLLVRRVDADQNVWVIERKGVQFTPPSDVHSTMDAACMLSREYGGTVAPGSERWNAATEAAPPPA